MIRLPARWQIALDSRPRETRDTLFLLAVLAWTLLPQIAQVPAWCAVLAYAALGWRARLAWRGAALPSRWLLLLALVGASLGTVISHQTLLGKSAGLTLLVVLAALKTLELRARRDATVVFFLGFFLVLASFLHSQALLTALAMGVSVWTLLAALVLAHMPDGRPPLSRALQLAARLLLTGLPLIVLLFLLFPRVAPLWSLPADSTGRTGLSEQMQLGQVAELAQDDSPALRVQFDGEVPPPELRYFRGPVLSDPDGTGWRTRPGLNMMPAPAPAPGTPLLRYRMTVEPLNIHTLPLLEVARFAPLPKEGQPRWLHHRDGAWLADRPLSARLQVEAQAVLDAPQHRPPGGLPPPADPRPADTAASLQHDLALPPGHHPRLIAWARQHLSRGEAAVAQPAWPAQQLLDHIRRQPYVYTLAPGASGPEPLDEFWLERRSGFCEHYASAFVVALRAIGVPARLVTGYQGGRINPVNGVLEVSQSDAHAWAEYHDPRRGWVRADPTAAVAPERILRPARVAGGGGITGTLSAFDPALVERLRAVWSAADHRWNQWVLGYGSQVQRDLARSLGWQMPDATTLAGLLAGLVAVLTLAGALVLVGPPRRRDPDRRWRQAHARLVADLRRRGLPVAGHHGPETLAREVRQRWGEAGEPLATRLQSLGRWRYAAAEQRAALGPLLRETRLALRRLPPP
ncbi:MAG: hypothetical protein RLZZ592_1023 [Pseudomonadota bacterium]|jgi:transglutaminase-like putative cysteine protease